MEYWITTTWGLLTYASGIQQGRNFHPTERTLGPRWSWGGWLAVVRGLQLDPGVAEFGGR